MVGDPAASIKARVKRQALRLLSPLISRRLRNRTMVELIRRSPFFDRAWYLVNNPDVRASGIDPALHYLKVGAAKGCDPGPWFSTSAYLEVHRDVAQANINPLLHYIRSGEKEGRSIAKSRCDGADAPKPPLIGETLAGRATFSILFISGEPHTPGNSYRVTRHVEAAKAGGLYAHWVAQADLPNHLAEIALFDAIVIWRAAWDQALSDSVDKARAAGAVIVFDVDDLMIEPELAQFDIIDGIRSQHLTEQQVRDHYTAVRRTMLAADICITTTEELAFYMRKANKATHVLPNGFDQATHDASRAAALAWRAERDPLLRIGYAGGSRTHQRDFALAVDAVARVLRENPRCRLVLFQHADTKVPLIDADEYPALAELDHQIEWRAVQPLDKLPQEMARFDINLAPLETGNPFCEAKSELKFFEAALVDVPTIASPTGPFRRAMVEGGTGCLAATAQDWYAQLDLLVKDAELRRRLARNAYYAALATFGPMQRRLRVGRFVEQLRGGDAAARGFALESWLARREWSAPTIPPSDLVFEQRRGGYAQVTVAIPLYNYEQYVGEALDSVLRQTLAALDLVIVDGCSTDRSLDVALAWAKQHADRFNRIAVLKNRSNVGLGFCRNAGFDAADSRYVLPLDADNRLLPPCCETLLAAAEASGAAYVYPTIRHFGGSSLQISNLPFDAQRFVFGNFVDAMALVSKEAWAMAGGYDHVRFGWEDYDLWCRLAEIGVSGTWCSEVLAEYRVHARSMMNVETMVSDNYASLHADFERRHPWVSLYARGRSGN